VLPGRSFKVNLTVNPIRRWWRRPLIGEGIKLNFMVELQDKQKLPLPENLPKATLLWKARPWWQFLLLALAVIGLLVGLAFVVWALFLKPSAPPEVVGFSRDNYNDYIEGNEVRLNWKIDNFDQLSKLELKTEEPGAGEPEDFDFNNGIPGRLKDCCQKQEQTLICNNFPTGDKKAGVYSFTLGAFPRGRDTVSYKQIKEVKIDEKPAPKVVSFGLDKAQYTKGNFMLLSWQIQNPDQLEHLKIIGKTENGTEPGIASYTPNNLSKAWCKEANQLLTCTNVPMPTPLPGKYTFELQAFSKSHKPPSSQPSESKIEILPKPFKIIYFTINGSQDLNLVFKEGQPLLLSWKVEGEDIHFGIPPYGNDLGPTNSLKLTANKSLHEIQLIVTDDFGSKPKRKGFSIEVETPPPSPSPSPSPSLSPLRPNNPINKLQQLIKPRGRFEPFPANGN